MLTSSASEIKACMGNGWHDEGTTWYGTMIDANTTGVKYRRVLKKSYVGGGFPITLV